MLFKSFKKPSHENFCPVFKRNLCDDKNDDEDDDDDGEDDDDDDNNHHASQGSIKCHKETPFPCFVPEKLQDRIQY